jgi:two-component system chemotaxis sensor kinase CheA
MVPLRQIFQKLSRVVRRLRRDLDKQVAFDWKGGDTELDKLIVEQLADPLMHIVRNAIDHAIEPAAERASAGKPRQGSIRVDAFQRGNSVLIEVRDDGRGLDPGAIRARAEALDLVDPGAALSEKEVFDLLFLPGFSTRSQVSETSGRGVGMDVVRSNLKSLGGIVEIRSELGAGTVVTLTLPVTLAIVRALLVGVGDQRYAIPLNSVLETLLVDRSEIQRSEGREILNLRGQPLILRRLREEFALEREEGDPARSRKHYVVVLGLGEMRVGLLVDRLAGQQDTVIKQIRGPIRQIRGVAGATEVGDQGAVLVLDIASIVEGAMRRKDAA